MGLFDRVRKVFAKGSAVIPREPVSYRPIGVVRNRVRESMPGGWETIRSDILLRDDLVDSVDWLAGFSHVIVVIRAGRRARFEVKVDRGERRTIKAEERDFAAASPASTAPIF